MDTPNTMAAQGREGAPSPEADWLEWTARMFLDVPTGEVVNRVAELPQPGLLAYSDAAIKAQEVLSLASEMKRDPERVRDASLDYTWLYCACRDGAPYPYESVYADDSRLLMRMVRDEVMAFYDEAGFDAKGVSALEPEDHLGVELAFMAHLVRTGRQEILRDFAKDHTQWISSLADETREQAGGEFYPRLAELAVALVQVVRQGV